MLRAPSNHRFRPLRCDPVVITALLVAVCVAILGGCTKPAPPRTRQAATKIRVAAATDIFSVVVVIIAIIFATLFTDFDAHITQHFFSSPFKV